MISINFMKYLGQPNFGIFSSARAEITWNSCEKEIIALEFLFDLLLSFCAFFFLPIQIYQVASQLIVRFVNDVIILDVVVAKVCANRETVSYFDELCAIVVLVFVCVREYRVGTSIFQSKTKPIDGSKD